MKEVCSPKKMDRWVLFCWGKTALLLLSYTRMDLAIKASDVVANLMAEAAKPSAGGEFIEQRTDSIRDAMCPD